MSGVERSEYLDLYREEVERENEQMENAKGTK
jgi:hypothetical protein